MPILANYHEFAGRHWETGTVCNALAYQGVIAPHTGHPISEALLLGISGGIAVGYFTFEYSGYLPHIALLTRNTFDPLAHLLERLAIPQEVFRTSNPQKGVTNLTEALESGKAALVWADAFTLPYNDLSYDEHNWAMFPILVYGHENATAYLADRAACGLEIPAETLQKARARVKKDEFRVVTLGTPHWERLPAAVNQAIWQCLSLFTEAPPKGARHNFGLAALEHWAALLTNTRNKQSWTRYFERGERLWMALVGNVTQTGAYGFIQRGAGNGAERGMYADFLDEAAVILHKPVLREAAQQFRMSAAAWSELAECLLPANVPLLHEAKTLLNRKRTLFIEHGAAHLDEIQAANQRLRELQKLAAADFPLSATQITAAQAQWAEQVLKIHALEQAACQTLQQMGQ
jgi:hypothetical protein